MTIRILLGLVLILAVLGTVAPVTVIQTIGVIDNFVSGNTNRETPPQSPTLQSCTQYDWQNVKYYNNATGDLKSMTSPYFDWKPDNSALVWTVSNLPTDKLLSNVRIEMVIKGNGSSCGNDGWGFMWDDNIQASKPNCRFQYFRKFENLFGTYAMGDVKTFNWTIPSNELCDTSKTILQKIKETGYFHFLVGDDSSVDYFRLTYEYDNVPQNIVSFTCKNYTNKATLTGGSCVYTDDTAYTITSITDSIQNPFKDSSLISTVIGDKNLTQSVFKVEIQSATRFWLFVPSTTTLSWVTAGGWELQTGASVVITKGTTTTTFSVYTKRYDGPRWVIFGNPSETGATVSSRMYFVSFSPTGSLIAPTSNQAGSCDCSSTGDPHYVTWDNRRYDFYEPGVYSLVKSRDCSFDVQTLTFKYGTSVTVNGVISVRYLNNTVTLARTESTTAGGAWTGSPIVRLNSQIITNTASAGGLTATFVNINEWRVSIASVGLSVRAVVSGTWFHVYPTLSDPSYQRKVDGLCGNCDGNPSNDFKFPDCQNAIANTAAKLVSSDVAQWGLSWKVSSSQQVANLSVLSNVNLGTTTYSACLAAPITQQCSDLVLPEPPQVVGTTKVPVTDPSEPSNFVTCSGTTVVPPVNPPIPEPPPDTNPPLLCTNNPKYNDIKAKCTSCLSVTRYPVDDCILDICLSGQEPSTYECPGANDCQNATTPTQTTTSGGYQFATLGNGLLAGVPTSPYCQPVKYRLPPGWEVAPNTGAAQTVIAGSPWEANCVATSDGVTFATSYGLTRSGTCPTDGAVIRTGDGCYNANQCGVRILIRKALTPVCGNGVLEGSEQCDDKNTEAADGCSPTCTLESPNDWSCDTSQTPTVCYPVNNIVGEPQYLPCLIELPECTGCLLTPENQFDQNCCECSVPCCA